MLKRGVVGSVLLPKQESAFLPHKKIMVSLTREEKDLTMLVTGPNLLLFRLPNASYSIERGINATYNKIVPFTDFFLLFCDK
ncbi:hypothetical protein C0J52_00805 [Blattella germanica]|nr:hypothetical protein C0J52_00805 [Blattella germanica]